MTSNAGFATALPGGSSSTSTSSPVALRPRILASSFPRRALRSESRRRRRASSRSCCRAAQRRTARRCRARRSAFRSSADLVADVAVRRDAVEPVEAHVDAAHAHQVAAGVVRDHGMRDAVLPELPRGEARALVARPRLVDPHVDREAALVRGVDRRERGAPIDRGEPARVAVGEQPGASTRTGVSRRRAAPRRARRSRGRARRPRRRAPRPPGRRTPRARREPRRPARRASARAPSAGSPRSGASRAARRTRARAPRRRGRRAARGTRRRPPSRRSAARRAPASCGSRAAHRRACAAPPRETRAEAGSGRRISTVVPSSATRMVRCGTPSTRTTQAPRSGARGDRRRAKSKRWPPIAQQSRWSSLGSCC